MQKGFTMVETLVSVAILMMAIAGPLTIAQKGLSSALLAQDQATASFLAQDAMEFIKNIKESNILNRSKDEFADKIDECTVESNPCSIDTVVGNPNASLNNYSSAGIAHCNPSSTCKLNLTTAGYTHTSGTPTKFSRYFYLKRYLNNQDQYQITVVVEWNRLINHSVVYQSNIFKVLK